jgi:hypothetical protein
MARTGARNLKSDTSRTAESAPCSRILNVSRTEQDPDRDHELGLNAAGSPVAMSGYPLGTARRLFRILDSGRITPATNDPATHLNGVVRIILEIHPPSARRRVAESEQNNTLLYSRVHFRQERAMCPAPAQNLSTCPSPRGITACLDAFASRRIGHASRVPVARPGLIRLGQPARRPTDRPG